MWATAIDEVAAQGLPSVETVAVNAAMAHQRQRFGDDDLRAGDREGHIDADRGGEVSGLRARRDDEVIASENAGRGGD